MQLSLEERLRLVARIGAAAQRGLARRERGRIPSGSAPAVLRAMREPPHLHGEDVDVLEQAIAAGKLPVRPGGVFDHGDCTVIFLLDTTTVSDLMHEDPRVASKLADIAIPDRVVTCAIVRGEIRYGIERLPAGKQQRPRRQIGPSFCGDSLRSGSACRGRSLREGQGGFASKRHLVGRERFMDRRHGTVAGRYPGQPRH